MKLFLWTALLACIACQGSPAAATQVVVLVGGDIAATALDATVYDVSGRARSSARRIDLKQRAPHRIPTSFTLVPAAQDPALHFRLVVQGISEDAGGAQLELARREVIAGFMPGHTTLLPIVLAEACAGEHCGCSNREACEDTCLTVLGDTVCQPVPTYPTLPDVVPGMELEQIQEGLPPCTPGDMPTAEGGCEDLDECAFFLDTCNTDPRACVNTRADQDRYFCHCPSGYSGTGEADDPCVPCVGSGCE